jgi:predicted short-subunit dehydrogenase-like oxidoreductase (DUF2520 family)
MNVSGRIAAEGDLSGVMARAVRAAKRGDTDVLERELTRLRRLNSVGAGTIGTTLRRMAQSARAHPSFQAPDTAAQAG